MPDVTAACTVISFTLVRAFSILTTTFVALAGSSKLYGGGRHHHHAAPARVQAGAAFNAASSLSDASQGVRDAGRYARTARFNKSDTVDTGRIRHPSNLIGSGHCRGISRTPAPPNLAAA